MQHNIKNRTIFCHDNLPVMQGMNSESIDLIYLDPPFNKNKKFTAPIGSASEGAEFNDIFREEDVKDEWLLEIKEDTPSIYKLLNTVKELNGMEAKGKNNHTLYNYCYLAYMAIRLIEMKRILKDTGSMYYHCDPTMSHHLKILMDIVFGEDNFRNEIVWCYKWGGSPSKRYFKKKHDVILRYSKGDGFVFNYEEVLVYGEKSGWSDESRGRLSNDWWADIPSLNTQAKEKVGYPTQKPVALIERIIKASCPEDGIVLDPFCGCATTCVAAERLGRQWTGIDVSPKAHILVLKRLKEEVKGEVWNTNRTQLIQPDDDFFKWDSVVTPQNFPPKRTDIGKDYQKKKYVYVFSNQKAYPGWYKVGVATDWKGRLNSYQTSDPNRGYKDEFKVHTPKFREIERMTHERFPRRGDKGEWVQADLKEIVSFIKGLKP